MSTTGSNLLPVKCFTCGKVIACMYEPYKKRVAQLKLQKNDKTNGIQYFTKDTINMSIEGEVMDELNLMNICCRRHILGFI